jgi:hypothetical protein
VVEIVNQSVCDTEPVVVDRAVPSVVDVLLGTA